VVNYLLKPFDQDALRERLQQYAATARSLAAIEEAAQPDIDKLFRTAPGRRSEQLPKGLSPESAELVRRALQQAPGSLSAAETAERTGLSRVSARRYLEHFASTGRAEVRLRYGAAGRPERLYAWRSG
jgi:response regulator of citrate/malate metabolism